MTVLRFDGQELASELAPVLAILQTSFAAACAERLFPAYAAFCRVAGRGDEGALAAILERIWEHLLGDQMDEEQIEEDLGRCMQLIPHDEDEPWVEGQGGAQNAASAVAYALRSLQSGDPQDAAWAGRTAFDFAYFHVSRRLGIKDLKQALAHPVVQAELARQRRDLEWLNAPGDDPASLIARLREQAKADAGRLQ